MAFLDFKHVKKHFEEQGCKLLEKEYVGAHAKMRYVCSCGNESSINWNNFKNGKRCGCGRKGMGRLPEDEIKKEVESIGFEFISNKYINRYNIVTCRCKCGNIRTCKLVNLRNNSKCRKCFYSDFSLDFEFVKNYFSENGCELLEKEYKNAKKRLKYRCSCGKESEICFFSFKSGNRCRDCGNKKVSDWLRENRRGEANPRWIKDRQLPTAEAVGLSFQL